MTKTVDVDKIAEQLLLLGYQAKHMAPAWEKAGQRQPAMGSEGQFVGWMLPGRGLLLDGLDAKRLGITRHIPYVYDYSPFARKRDYFVRRFRDLHRSEVGAITTYDGIIAARAGGKARDAAFSKATITTVASFWYDLWVATGSGGAGTFLNTTAPTDSALDSSTSGSLFGGSPFNPSGSDKSYLLTFGIFTAAGHFLGMLIDRHIQGGNYRLSVDPAETTGTPDTVTRDYGGGAGVGAQLIATVTTARATPGAGTWTINYLDQAGAASATPAQALAATADPVNRLIAPGGVTALPFFPLEAGDTGVKQIVSSDRAAALDTTGGTAISIVQPLVWIPMLNTANIYVERDLPSDLTGLLELANVSLVTGCLSFLLYANGASSSQLTGFARTCQG
jgi:hypothetical protein